MILQRVLAASFSLKTHGGGAAWCRMVLHGAALLAHAGPTGPGGTKPIPTSITSRPCSHEMRTSPCARPPPSSTVQWKTFAGPATEAARCCQNCCSSRSASILLHHLDAGISMPGRKQLHHWGMKGSKQNDSKIKQGTNKSKCIKCK